MIFQYFPICFHEIHRFSWVFHVSMVGFRESPMVFPSGNLAQGMLMSVAANGDILGERGSLGPSNMARDAEGDEEM